MKKIWHGLCLNEKNMAWVMCEAGTGTHVVLASQLVFFLKFSSGCVFLVLDGGYQLVFFSI